MKKFNYKQQTFTIDPIANEQLQILGKLSERGASFHVREAIKEYMERLPEGIKEQLAAALEV